MQHRIITFVTPKDFSMKEFEEWALSHKLMFNATIAEDTYGDDEWKVISEGLAKSIRKYFNAPNKKKQHDEDGADRKKAIQRAG